MDHLIAHYSVVGGDGEVIKSAMLVQKHLLGPVARLEVALNSHANGAMGTFVNNKISLIYCRAATRNEEVEVSSWQTMSCHW